MQADASIDVVCFNGSSSPLRIAVVTETYPPDINGVAHTLSKTVEGLKARGHALWLIRPRQNNDMVPAGRSLADETLVRGMPIPFYKHLKMGFPAKRALTRLWTLHRPDVVHIATEGSLGLAARRVCIKHGIAFTTAFHTRLAEYVHARFAFVPEALIWRMLRWFHAPATAVMVATQSLKRDLAGHGFKNLRLWSRGVDVKRFRPIPDRRHAYDRPVWIYVGRVAVEKNVEAFLSLDLPGTKVIVGDGPARGALERKYPNAKFLGALSGEPLVQAYAASDVFAFPSRTDTFGLVLLEALACGLTVAAYPVEGPRDVVGPEAPGAADVAALDSDLRAACLAAWDLKQHPRALSPCAFAGSHSWRACTLQFLRNLAVEPD